MPTAARKPCTWPGCPALVSGGSRCERHRGEARRQADAARASSSERGYSAAWQKARRAFLSKHPLCAEHERRGELRPATVVDHVVPHRGDKTLFWTRTNWQPLCKPCHDRKTATEDGGFGRGAEVRGGGGS